MNAAITHIMEQVKLLDAFTDRYDLRHQRAVIHGMCMAYFRADLITMDEWNEVVEKTNSSKMVTEHVQN